MSEKFSKCHKDVLDKMDEEEMQQQKTAKESFGVGGTYECIICRSNENQEDICLQGNYISTSLVPKMLNMKKHEYDCTLSICGHHIHRKCWKQQVRTNNKSCSLCNSLCNCLIPVA